MSDLINVQEQTRKHIIEDIGERTNEGSGFKNATIIENAVYTYIQTLLAEVAVERPEFKVSEILKVGSYSEDTKILTPNEFDFLAVIDELSKPDVVKVIEKDYVPETTIYPGIVNVTIKDEYTEQWTRYCTNGRLNCFQKSSINITFDNNRDTFGNVVINTIRKLAKIEGRRIMKLDQNLDFMDDCPGYHSKLSENDKIDLKCVEVRHPNILMKFVTEDADICVDVSPAIRVYAIADCFSPNDCLFPELAESIMNRGSVLLVGRLDTDFRVTFTETEVDYMKNKIKPRHKQLYVYLKHICHFFDKYMEPLSLSSYSLKMICIRHDMECVKSENNLTECFGDVVTYMRQCFEDWYLPSVFNKKLNIFHDSLDILSGKFRVYIMDCFTKIQELHKGKQQCDSVSEHLLKVHDIIKEAIHKFLE